MPDELNMLAEIEEEGKFDFDSLQKDEQVETPAESQPEEDNKEEVVEEEDDKSSKQSRNWKQMREELAAERAERAEEKRLREEADEDRQKLKDRLDALEKTDTSIEQPEFLKQMVGDNADVAKSFQEYEEKLLEKAEARILERQESQAKAKQKQVEEANNFIENQITAIEKEHGVSLKAGSNERNELLKTVYEYAPTDAQNNYDLAKGFKIMQALKGKEQATENEKTEARKIIADTTLSKNTGGKETKTYVTSNDIRKAGGWRGFISKKD